MRMLTERMKVKIVTIEAHRLGIDEKMQDEGIREHVDAQGGADEDQPRMVRGGGELVMKCCWQAGPLENGVTLQKQTGQKGPEV